MTTIPKSFVILTLNSGDAMWAKAEEYNLLRGKVTQYVAGQIADRLLTFEHINGCEVNIALSMVHMVQKHTQESYYANQVINYEIGEVNRRAREQVLGPTFSDDDDDDDEEYIK